MAKKNFEKGLEKLFSNVQSSEPTEEKEEAPVKDDSATDEQNNTRRGRPALHNKVIRFCTMADDDKVTKIRTIAAREGISIKDKHSCVLSVASGKAERTLNGIDYRSDFILSAPNGIEVSHSILL